MPATCYVPGCRSRKSKNSQVSFHSFPKGHRKDWLTAIGRDPDTFIIYQRICSVHFKSEDFENIGVNIHLKPGVIPSLNLPLQQTVEHASTTAITLHFPTFKNELAGNLANLDPLAITPSTSATDNDILSTSCLETVPCSTGSILIRQRRSPIRSSPSVLVKNRFTINKPTYSKISETSQGHGRTSNERTSSASITFASRKRLKKIIYSSSLSPEHYKKQILQQKAKRAAQIVKSRKLKQKSLREKKKIDSLSHLVLDLQKKYNMSLDAISTLENSFPDIPLAELEGILANMKLQGITENKYPEELKHFAMTLKFFNRKAYNYLRTSTDLILPTESTITSWLPNTTCDPGFSKPSLNALKEKSEQFHIKHGKTLICSLLIDEMSIQRQLFYDKGHTWGYVNVGTTNTSSDEQQVATEVLVLMAVAVNDYFKVPIGYFFVSSLTGEEKANVVKEALFQMNFPNVKVVGLTCYGPQLQLTMMKELGLSVKNPNNCKTFFEHPANDQDVYVMFDICHMAKLLKNNWVQAGTFIDDNGQYVKWEYIKALQNIQQKSGLYLANKLKRNLVLKHVILKVNPTSQPLSGSVADALQFLHENLKYSELEGVEATIRFIRIFHNLFDLLNSRNLFGSGMKTPMQESNEFYWKPFLTGVIKYLKSLKDRTGRPLYMTQRSTPILGLLVTCNSILQIYEREVKLDRTVKFLLTYKFSQDNLELFFCSVRSRNRWKNNLNSLEFARTYKSLLLQNCTRDAKGNHIAQDQTSVLPVGTSGKIINISDVYFLRQETTLEHSTERINLFLPYQFGEYALNILAYISGIIVKKLDTVITCCRCKEALRTNDLHSSSYDLIVRKARPGLIYPSKDVQIICVKIEKRIQLLTKLFRLLPPDEVVVTFLLKESANLLQDKNLFAALDDHVFDYCLSEVVHKKVLMDAIIREYGLIRIESILRNMNVLRLKI